MCVIYNYHGKLFEKLLTDLEIPQPKGYGVYNLEEALDAAKKLGFPVLVRPSYVIGGRGMQLVYNDDELTVYINEALKFSNGHPVLIDQYLEGVEVELDAICDGENILVPGINEHIESILLIDTVRLETIDGKIRYNGVDLCDGEICFLYEEETNTVTYYLNGTPHVVHLRAESPTEQASE